MKLDNKTLNKYLLLFVSLLVATVFFLLKGEGLITFLRTIKNLDIKYIAIGILVGLAFVICESINLKVILNSFGYKVNVLTSLKYAFVGFFFCAVTPSASGGQPMQVYYMRRDDIKISHSTCTLLVELAIFQFLSLSIGLISLLFVGKSLVMRYKLMIPLITFGVLMHVIIILIIIMAILNADMLKRIGNKIIKVLSRINIIKDDQKAENSVHKYIEEFRVGANHIKRNPLMMLRVVLTTCIQLLFKYSIPYWVYRGLGYSQFNVLNIISIQAILSIAVSSLPLLGGVGISEGGFAVLFSSIFPFEVIKSAALISRGVGFYSVLIFSAAFTFLGTIKDNKIKKSHQYNKKLHRYIRI